MFGFLCVVGGAQIVSVSVLSCLVHLVWSVLSRVSGILSLIQARVHELLRKRCPQDVFCDVKNRSPAIEDGQVPHFLYFRKIIFHFGNMDDYDITDEFNELSVPSLSPSLPEDCEHCHSV